MQNNRKRTIFCLLFAIAFLASFQVMILNRSSTSGEKLATLSHEIETIEQENNQLNQEIASASAIAVLHTKAMSLGLSKSVELLTLTLPLQVALTNDRSL